ncbi:MAG: alpha/beta hydrolase [Desulfobulbaceae bacterium]|jgi:pimeloyl-ACP methyl ester carboxylesterase|nr:alpha/beta hydrolase [Desulfobulbaceae bacterium]
MKEKHVVESLLSTGRTGMRSFPCNQGIIAAILALVLAAALLTGCSVHTAPFTDEQGGIIPGSIAVMETVTIGGVPQSIWFRGTSTANPPLILLHGGPGISESALFRHYNSILEQHFLVVYWEQRGAGRSFHAGIPPQSMTVARFLLDLDEVVEEVRRRFGRKKVVLLGHSWGTILGTIYASQHPEKIAVYVGVAQIADMVRGDRLSYDYVLAEAARRENARALAQLTKIGPPPHSVDDRLKIGRWNERFGGMFHGDLSTGKLILAALSTDEANLWDIILFGRGNRFSLTRLHSEYSRMRLNDRYRSFRVPVFFLLGRHDRHVPSVLAEEYFRAIEAPCKRLVWFERSAHNPPFEEPGQFNEVLIREVLPLAGAERIAPCGVPGPAVVQQPPV